MSSGASTATRPLWHSLHERDQARLSELARHQVVIDGKSLRGSRCADDAVNMVSAFVTRALGRECTRWWRRLVQWLAKSFQKWAGKVNMMRWTGIPHYSAAKKEMHGDVGSTLVAIRHITEQISLTSISTIRCFYKTTANTDVVTLPYFFM